MTFVLVMVFWVFSVCLHEFGHAVVAYFGGDRSVRDKGYLSFNPIYYVDPTTSVLLPLLFLALGGIGLPGGAVYIDRSRLRSKQWEMAVSLAGPAANLIFAAAIGIALQFDGLAQSSVAPTLAFLAWLQISAVLLNLIPVPPLDGYGAIAPFLSHQTRVQLAPIAQFGIWIVFALFWFSHTFNAAFFSTVTQITADLGVPVTQVYEGYREFFFWKVR